jgi:hypothetical protein
LLCPAHQPKSAMSCCLCAAPPNRTRQRRTKQHPVLAATSSQPRAWWVTLSTVATASHGSRMDVHAAGWACHACMMQQDGYACMPVAQQQLLMLLCWVLDKMLCWGQAAVQHICYSSSLGHLSAEACCSWSFLCPAFDSCCHTLLQFSAVALPAS